MGKNTGINITTNYDREGHVISTVTTITCDPFYKFEICYTITFGGPIVSQKATLDVNDANGNIIYTKTGLLASYTSVGNTDEVTIKEED